MSLPSLGQRESTELTRALSADSEFYALQHERSRLLSDKETLQVVYEELVRSYSALKDDHVRPSPSSPRGAADSSRTGGSSQQSRFCRIAGRRRRCCRPSWKERPRRRRLQERTRPYSSRPVPPSSPSSSIADSSLTQSKSRERARRSRASRRSPNSHDRGPHAQGQSRPSACPVASGLSERFNSELPPYSYFDGAGRRFGAESRGGGEAQGSDGRVSARGREGQEDGERD